MRAGRLASLGAVFALLGGVAGFAASCQKRAPEATKSKTAAADSIAALALSPGQADFLANCAMCHGTWGGGDGPLAPEIARIAKVRPAVLLTRQRLEALGRDEVVRVIERGGAHTGRSNLMPAWDKRLDHRVIEQIADYVMTLPDRSPGPPEATVVKFLAAPPGSAPEGRKLFVFYCTTCHGPEGHGDGRLADTLWARNHIRPRNLTDSTYLAGKTDQELELTVALGGGYFHKSTFMPAWSVTLPPDQIKDLVSYVRAISRTASR